MYLIRTKRIFKTAIINFVRNGWLSLTATLIMTLALLTVGVFLVVALSTNKIVGDLKDRVDIVVNFKDTAGDSLIQQFKSELLIRPAIKTVKYISKEEALKEFQSRDSVKKEVRDLVTSSENPLPRGLQIQSIDPKEFEFVSNLAKTAAYAPYVDSSSYDDNKTLIENLNNATHFIERFGLALAGFFIIVAMLVVFNTIRLAVAFRQKEIEIMRLVGASESYVKIPFLIEGFGYSFIALIVASILINLGVHLVGSIASGGVFSSYIARLTPIYAQEFWFITLILFLVGTVIGVGASWLSIRRNFKS